MNGYSKVILRAVLLGVFGGGFGVAYLWLVEGGIHALWQDWETIGWFSGSLPMLLIPVLAGLLVGLIYKLMHLPSRFEGFIAELEHGRVEPRTAPGAILVALVSLIGGASLGPEAPVGTAGGAAGTWMARRAGEDADGVRQGSFVGISAAFGGLMATPLGGPLLAFELEHEQTGSYYFRHLVPGVLSGAIAFAIFWPVLGAPFKGLLAMPAQDFESWMLLVAVGLGVFSAAAAFAVGKIMISIRMAMQPLDRSPVLRGLVGGAAVGVIAYSLPLTLFSGSESVGYIMGNLDRIGILMLLALALAKAIALGASLGGGFYGGPIFPLFFIGAVLGMIVHTMFPAVPLALAVSCTMAGLGAAVSMIPLSMAVLATILTSAGLEFSAAIVLAAVVAYAVRYAVTHAPSDTARTMSPG